jgi:hypothetical protein
VPYTLLTLTAAPKYVVHQACPQTQPATLQARKLDDSIEGLKAEVKGLKDRLREEQMDKQRQADSSVKQLKVRLLGLLHLSRTRLAGLQACCSPGEGILLYRYIIAVYNQKMPLII